MSRARRIVPRPRRTLASVFGVLALVTAAAIVPGCSDGEGTLFTISSVPSADGSSQLLVYRTRGHGWDDNQQRSFSAYVEVYAEQTDEFLPRGITSKDVFVRIYTFDGPPWPEGDVELRFDGHATALLADGDFVERGEDQIEVPGTGNVQRANYFACGAAGSTLMRVSARQSARFHTGGVFVELDFDQLQGIAKFLARAIEPAAKEAGG